MSDDAVIRLYGIPLSHPVLGVRETLAFKRLPYRYVELLAGGHPPMLWALGFRGGTVPAVKLPDGRRIQGSLAIAQALEQIAPAPSLYPSQPAARAAVSDAERWGEAVLQPIPRRLIRWGLRQHLRQRQWFADVASPLPLPSVAGLLLTPIVPVFARIAGANSVQVRHDLDRLPGLLDEVDRLIAHGVTGGDQERQRREGRQAVAVRASVARLGCATTQRKLPMMVKDPLELPDDLPVPEDDGAADHLAGMALPPVSLRATDGTSVRLDRLEGRTVVFAYPRTGRPAEPSPGGDDEWDAIPGARGCTPQACSFRDEHARFAAADTRVLGLSTQDTAYQQEAIERLRLPYPLLSDERLELATALRLPTFEVDGMTLLKRLTLFLRDGAIESVIYPVFPPNRSAEQALARLAA